MTPEQIEAAARKLCELRGAASYDDLLNDEMREIVKDKIRAHQQVQEAIASAVQLTEHPKCCECGHWHIQVVKCPVPGCSCLRYRPQA